MNNKFKELEKEFTNNEYIIRGTFRYILMKNYTDAQIYDLNMALLENQKWERMCLKSDKQIIEDFEKKVEYLEEKIAISSNTVSDNKCTYTGKVMGHTSSESRLERDVFYLSEEAQEIGDVNLEGHYIHLCNFGEKPKSLRIKAHHGRCIIVDGCLYKHYNYWKIIL